MNFIIAEPPFKTANVNNSSDLIYGDYENDNKALKKAWKYYKNQSKSIEVIYNNDDQKVLAKVHFRTDPSVS